MAEENNGVERRVAYEGRFVKLDEQVKRLVSDAESEKDTRRRVNISITEHFAQQDRRIESIEKKIYWFSGIISGFVFLVHWYFKG